MKPCHLFAAYFLALLSGCSQFPSWKTTIIDQSQAVPVGAADRPIIVTADQWGYGAPRGGIGVMVSSRQQEVFLGSWFATFDWKSETMVGRSWFPGDHKSTDRVTIFDSATGHYFSASWGQGSLGEFDPKTGVVSTHQLGFPVTSVAPNASGYLLLQDSAIYHDDKGNPVVRVRLFDVVNKTLLDDKFDFLDSIYNGQIDDNGCFWFTGLDAGGQALFKLDPTTRTLKAVHVEVPEGYGFGMQGVFSGIVVASTGKNGDTSLDPEPIAIDIIVIDSDTLTISSRHSDKRFPAGHLSKAFRYNSEIYVLYSQYFRDRETHHIMKLDSATGALTDMGSSFDFPITETPLVRDSSMYLVDGWIGNRFVCLKVNLETMQADHIIDIPIAE